MHTPSCYCCCCCARCPSGDEDGGISSSWLLFIIDVGLCCDDEQQQQLQGLWLKLWATARQGEAPEENLNQPTNQPTSVPRSRNQGIAACGVRSPSPPACRQLLLSSPACEAPASWSDSLRRLRQPSLLRCQAPSSSSEGEAAAGTGGEPLPPPPPIPCLTMGGAAPKASDILRFPAS